MTHKEDISAEIIGQIALMQGMVARLPVDKILPFSIQGLKDIPGITELIPEAVEADFQHKIAYRERLYGVLSVRCVRKECYLPYRPYVENFCTMLGVVFEQKHQQEMNQILLGELEQRVEERTEALKIEIDAREARWKRIQEHQEALISLSKAGVIQQGELDRGYRLILEKTREILKVNRASIWHFNDDGSELHCIHQNFLDPQPDNIDGMVIKEIDFPCFFASQKEGWCVAIEHAREAVETSEFRDQYMIPFDIYSLINATFWIEGKPVGVICHEHTGAPRKWYDDEVLFARAIGDLLAQLYLTHIQKEVEHQLRQSQKMEAIGQLAGGVAHDFNNMLTGIISAAGILKMRIENPREIKLLNMILNASGRAADLTEKLLAFGRKQQIVKEITSLHKIIDDVITLLERVTPPDIKISSVKGAESDLISGDSSAIQSLLMNLCINAHQAIQGKGYIDITTHTIRLTEQMEIGQSAKLPPGTYIEIEVIDSGSGIQSEIIDRIFEPFFTTKEVGSGTGLGLALVYGIVKEHQGDISVKSEPGTGTSFTILLPAVEQSAVLIDHKEGESCSGSGTLLLVDDDEIVREATSFLLEDLGYEVLIAEDGFEAIELFQKHHQKIHCVILDMVMPEIDGRQTFMKLREIAPECRVIIASGFVPENRLEDMEDISGFIQKPFRDFELSQLLYQVIHN